MNYSFTDKVQKWDDVGGWFYVRLPKDTYNDLREIGAAHKRGFGSIKVEVTIGRTTWRTSIFPDTNDRTYILFIKKMIREAEKIELDSKVSVDLRLIV